jgi:hypothetical protein
MEVLSMNLDYCKLIIKDWMKEHKLTKKNAVLLLEAYRRFHEFYRPSKGPISEAWLGMGSPSVYKSPYFVPVHKPLPRVSNWYKLNRQGRILLSKLNALLPWNENYNEYLFRGELI